MIAQDPDDDELVALYCAYEGRLGRLLRAKLRVPDDLVDEIVNDTFLAVARKWDRGENIHEMEAFLAQVAVNEGIDRMRRRYIEIPDPDLVDAATRSGPDMIAELDLRCDLRQALEKLPPRQQEAVVRRYFLGQSVAETSKAMGIARGTVTSNTFDGLKNLRKIIEDEGGAWEGETR